MRRGLCLNKKKTTLSPQRTTNLQARILTKRLFLIKCADMVFELKAGSPIADPARVSSVVFSPKLLVNAETCACDEDHA